MTQSKYDHHSVQTTAMPIAAAAMVPASSGSSPAPMPMAMTDSPSATMMIRPWRSTK